MNRLCTRDARLPTLPLQIAVLTDVKRKSAHRLVEEAKARAQQAVQRDKHLISKNIRKYEHFFDSHGYSCPLASQFERILESGFPTINRFVDTLLIGEMSKGVLMGVQDWGSVAPPLRFDFARPSEEYEGMAGPISCREDEIVVRDGYGVIASYFQGSDKRTAITRRTKDVVFLALGLPLMSTDLVREALELCTNILSPAAESLEYAD